MSIKNILIAKPVKKLTLIIFLISFLGIFLVGLWPFNFNPPNNIFWQNNAAEKYLVIKHPSIAFFSPELLDFNSPEGFSIEMKLKANPPLNNYISRIFSLNRDNIEFLLIGQWKDGIILRLYDPVKKSYSELYAKDLLKPTEPVFLTIGVAKSSFISCNGEIILKSEKPLTSQTTPLRGIAVIGNSVSGKHGWNGELYSLKIYNHPLSKQKSTNFEKKEQFSFSGGEYTLTIPERFSPLKKNILTPPWIDLCFNSSYFYDVIINFVGFLAFGLLIGVLGIQNGLRKSHSLIISFLLCALISFTIELLQPFLPSRSSQLSDLILNILGGVCGCSLFLSSMQIKKSHVLAFRKST